MDISFEFQWESLLTSESVNYQFSQNIDKSLAKKIYGKPAIYRWNIFKNEKNDLKKIYIGETINLYKRVYQYNNPGSDQVTNIRMSKIFNDEITKGNQVELEILSFETIRIHNELLTVDDLKRTSARKFLENLFIVYYKKLGFEIKNAGG